MWQFITGLFTNKNVISNIMSGVDKAILTKEEKADLHLTFLKAYEPYRVTQRIIATILITVWALFSSIGLGTILAGGYFNNDKIAEVGKNGIEQANDTFGYPVLVIIGFYFMGGSIEGIVRANKRNKTKENV